MSNMLDVALDCIRRGWYVFPCKPREKRPLAELAPHGWHSASKDETQIREWWRRAPEANVAIACNQSNLCVVDVDYGLTGELDAVGFEHDLASSDTRPTYAVRTGRRPGYGVQIYYTGAVPDVGLFEHNGKSGQVKSLGGYVMAAGCVHPSGETYEVLWDREPAETPATVRALQTRTKNVSTEPGKKIPEGAGRHDALMRVACSLRSRGLDAEAIYQAMIPINEAMCEVPIEDEDLKAMCYGIEKRYEAGEPDPVPVLGTQPPAEPEPPRDWREKYHTREEMINAPPVNWVIKDFLPEESICGLGAPAGQRKSLIALNVAHAVLTGEPLFGKFPVVMKPERVLYLCPEMGIRSFTDRLRRIGLTDYIGEKLFCMTMSSPELVELKELTEEEVRGSLVILDTAIRYLKGDENSSEAMKEFAKEIFRLSKAGALAVLVLHHSGKGTKTSDELTLENCMRGSGEIGAFLTTCWGTRINGDDAYKSPSYLQNVKQRDAIYEALEVSSDDLSCRLTYVEPPEGAKATLKGRKTGPKPKPDDPAAEAIVKATPWLSDRALVQVLKDNGFTRSRDWVKARLLQIKDGNGGLMPSKPPGHNPPQDR